MHGAQPRQGALRLVRLVVAPRSARKVHVHAAGPPEPHKRLPATVDTAAVKGRPLRSKPEPTDRARSVNHAAPADGQVAKPLGGLGLAVHKHPKPIQVLVGIDMVTGNIVGCSCAWERDLVGAFVLAHLAADQAVHGSAGQGAEEGLADFAAHVVFFVRLVQSNEEALRRLCMAGIGGVLGSNSAARGPLRVGPRHVFLPAGAGALRDRQRRRGPLDGCRTDLRETRLVDGCDGGALCGAGRPPG
eukprot:CAMPEP_0170271062 /NCGR_PEP_ID=MMETSP0116_2-20130129/35479_1 /TAXON_ID=400756 /ORGANISM="Durinskia baltica, Strain CSIRO CS-38" /LENGTH=244 /DNA_ID=CAMNT_0010522261 /DNA_START=94 /DNA_END=824 /DNA_ORIENTATION=-